MSTYYRHCLSPKHKYRPGPEHKQHKPLLRAKSFFVFFLLKNSVLFQLGFNNGTHFSHFEQGPKWGCTGPVSLCRLSWGLYIAKNVFQCQSTYLAVSFAVSRLSITRDTCQSIILQTLVRDHNPMSYFISSIYIYIYIFFFEKIIYFEYSHS